MNEPYSEVRAQLRRQHAMNTNEIHGRSTGMSASSVQEESPRSESSRGFFALCIRFVLFMTCVLLFSCYLYGGQDVKKGAALAWKEMTHSVGQLEEDVPQVHQVMQYLRQTRQDVIHWMDTMDETNGL